MTEYKFCRKRKVNVVAVLFWRKRQKSTATTQDTYFGILILDIICYLMLVILEPVHNLNGIKKNIMSLPAQCIIYRLQIA